MFFVVLYSSFSFLFSTVRVVNCTKGDKLIVTLYSNCRLEAICEWACQRVDGYQNFEFLELLLDEAREQTDPAKALVDAVSSDMDMVTFGVIDFSFKLTAQEADPELILWRLDVNTCPPTQPLSLRPSLDWLSWWCPFDDEGIGVVVTDAMDPAKGMLEGFNDGFSDNDSGSRMSLMSRWSVILSPWTIPPPDRPSKCDPDPRLTDIDITRETSPIDGLTLLLKAVSKDKRSTDDPKRRRR